MVTAISEPYLYMSENAQLILVPDGRGEELQLHLQSAGIRSRLSQLPGISADLISFDGEPEIVQAILDEWEA